MGKKAAVVLLVALALTPFHLAGGQQQAKIAKIGWLEARSASALGRNLFGRQLREPGYVEGKNIAFEDRLPIGDENKNPGDMKLGERKRGRPRRTFEPW